MTEKDRADLRREVYDLLAIHASDVTKADEVARFIEENYDPKPACKVCGDEGCYRGGCHDGENCDYCNPYEPDDYEDADEATLVIPPVSP